MHKYLRAIGFSKIKDRKELQKILTDIVVNGTDRAYTSTEKRRFLLFSAGILPRGWE